MHFTIFHTYGTPAFKIKALCLVSNERWVKRLLLQYKWLIQPYLSLLRLKLAAYFVTQVMPINEINSKSDKTELKEAIIQPIV